MTSRENARLSNRRSVCGNQAWTICSAAAIETWANSDSSNSVTAAKITPVEISR